MLKFFKLLTQGVLHAVTCMIVIHVEWNMSRLAAHYKIWIINQIVAALIKITRVIVGFEVNNMS